MLLLPNCDKKLKLLRISLKGMDAVYFFCLKEVISEVLKKKKKSNSVPVRKRGN